MALVSRHHEIMTAIRSAIVADVDIVEAIPETQWKIQKRPWHRGQSWTPGVRISALMRQKPPHENSVVKIVCPVLVSMVWPSDGSLVGDMVSELAIMERIEQMFEFKGSTNAPAQLIALNDAHTGRDAYTFEQCYVTPGEQFIEGALRDGYDGCALVIFVEILALKTNEAI